MNLLIDFFPILVFFIVFKLKGIIAATIAAIIVSFIQLVIIKITTNQIPKIQSISFLILLILGGSAIICKKEIFIKLKPTVIYWVLATIFLITHYLSKKSILEKISNNAIKLPAKIWDKLNIIWAIFFILMGILNLYVVYCCDTNTWVNFKVFGTLGLTLLFVVCQTCFLAKYLGAKQ